ncbi:MAG: helix-turn-helix domain-containing protein [Terriglobia bacterium]|nr:helix-turn-helix domain-containing protein [Terriglobia bacterium]
MTIIEQIEQRSSALKVNELANILQVTPQHIYRLASQGLIPCFRIEGAIRLDPQELAIWLKSKQPKTIRSVRSHAA